MKVLFATDGSKHARFAEQFLLGLLEKGDAKIDLIAATVCPAANLHSLGFEVPTPVYEAVDACRKHSNEILTELAERMWTHVDSVEKKVLDGHPSQEILQLIDQVQPDLCLVGSHGWTASERFFLGSVSDQIAKHASCSVLIAKPTDNQFDQVTCDRILFADDGSTGATNALHRLESLPSISEAKVRLVSVIPDSFTFDAAIPEQFAEVLTEKKKERLEVLRKDSSELSVVCAEADYEVRVGSSIPQEILKAADDFSANMIFIGGKRKALLKRAILGSVSLSVLHHAHCSVWIER